MSTEAIRNAIFSAIAVSLVGNILLVYRLDERTAQMMETIKSNHEFVGNLREKVSALEYSCKRDFRCLIGPR